MKIIDFIALRTSVLKPRYCLISIGDIFLQQGDNINETQFISASSYLDVKQYCEKKLANFPYKNTFCNFFVDRHNELKSNNNFEILIKSFVSNGFQSFTQLN